MRVRIDRTYGLHNVQRFANEVARSFASREKTICCPAGRSLRDRVSRSASRRRAWQADNCGASFSHDPVAGPVDWSARNESGGWGRRDPVLVPGVRRCGDYPVEGVSAGAGR
jgi:hypothetical protein